MTQVQLALGRNLPLLVAAMATTAVAIGILIAIHPLFGLAALVALAFVPIVMVSLPLGIALWIPLTFLEGIPGTSSLPEAGGIVIVGAWVGVAARRGSLARRGLWAIRRQLVAIIALVAWLFLSLVWAGNPSATVTLSVSWALVGLLAAVVATSLETPAHLRLGAWAFVGGALLSVVVGALGLAVGLSGFDVEGRFQAAAGDPNYLGAQLVAALAITLGLFGTAVTARDRLLSTIILVPLVIGLVTSQSRGALVGLGVMAIASLFLFPGNRARVVLAVTVMVSLLGLTAAMNPAAMERFTASGDRGSGRTDLWTVSWRMIEDQPVLGVGLSNFGERAIDYTREPGQLENIQHVLRGQEPHNLYLGLYAETGPIGLALFAAVAGFAFAYGARASRLFARLRLQREDMLVRAIITGLIGMLTTSFFLPNGTDKRMWVLFGLLAASLAIASRMHSLFAQPMDRDH